MTSKTFVFNPNFWNKETGFQGENLEPEQVKDKIKLNESEIERLKFDLKHYQNVLEYMK